MIALRGDEHLCLVLEPAKRLAMHDPVAVALERGAQRTALLGVHAPGGGVGMHRQRAQRALFVLRDAGGESISDWAVGMAHGNARV